MKYEIKGAPFPVVVCDVEAGESIVTQKGSNSNLVAQKSAFMACESGVQMSIFFQKKIGSGIFGGEGFFNTRVTGPGRVWLQTMPISSVASAIIPYIPTSNN